MKTIKSVLVANRGEIAVRVIHACQRLDIRTVVAVSDADRDSLPARIADRSICIGPARATDSYLRPELMIVAALGSGCEAIHPGYGFLSERAAFARMCADAGLTFVGPPANAIELMGNKIAALEIAEAAGVPKVPGSGELHSPEEARRIANEIGYPVLLKAAAGGGGRGMRIVRSDGQMPTAIESAATEAGAAFGDTTLYLEKFIERARHIEIQILADDHGNVVHLGERECSTQRRHQKLIEEAPSSVLDDALRGQLCDAAVSLARRVGYRGAGTVEFVFDENTRKFYFLEMNTRIQVEHPVTEAVTGRDLVVEQLRIAGGESISFTQDEVQLQGHAIECRINAEDASRDFLPSPGKITIWNPPQGASIRVDTHCYPGYQVPPFYDSLLAKLIVHGQSRDEAIGRMISALADFDVQGILTTIPFHQEVLRHRDFQTAKVTTRWVEETFLANR